MNREEISFILGSIADRHIEEALEYEHDVVLGSKKIWKKVVAAVVIFVLGVTGLGTITFAANENFRNAVIRFVSSFSEGEKIEIREGHMTTNLSREDTLLEFLHQLQEERNLLRYGEDGFDYTFVEENSADVKVVVACKKEEEALLVELERSEIEKEVWAWKVKSYQMIPSEQAEKLLSGNEKKDSAPDKQEWTEEDEKKARDSAIKVTGKWGKIYRAIDKDHIVTLTEKETDMLASVFDRYQEDEEDGWYGQDYDYVILLPNHDLMMTEKGEVIEEKGDETIGYKMKANDLKRIMKLFKKHHF